MDYLRFAGRYRGLTAVVIGGGGQIGSAACYQLYAGGAAVVAVDRDQASLEVVRDSLPDASDSSAQFHPIHLAMDEPVAGKTLAGVVCGVSDVVQMLICVAGGVVGNDNVDFPSNDTFLWSYQQNFLIVPTAIRALLPALEKGKGAIAVAGSVNAVSGIGQFAYSAAKAALGALVRDVAVGFGYKGVRINIVHLGTVVDHKKPSLRWAAAMQSNPGLLTKIGAWLPRDKDLPPVATPAEAAAALCFFASPESTMFNGAEVVADAGWLAAAGTAYNMVEKADRPWFDRVL